MAGALRKTMIYLGLADGDEHYLVLAVLVALVAEPDGRGLAAAFHLVGEDRGVEVQDLH